VHWARVLENGRRLAPLTGARLDVVEYFAVFHDAHRLDDDRDRDHGRRAAQYLKENGRLLLPGLDMEGLELLCQACAGHVDGLMKGDITLQTCWDADRLDLGRVNIIPKPERLCTKAAREPEALGWAKQRAYLNTIPDLIHQEWELTLIF
jgi:uncharacterized protein